MSDYSANHTKPISTTCGKTKLFNIKWLIYSPLDYKELRMFLSASINRTSALSQESPSYEII
jgi:hypothetical protein